MFTLCSVAARASCPALWSCAVELAHRTIFSAFFFSLQHYYLWKTKDAYRVWLFWIILYFLTWIFFTVRVKCTKITKNRIHSSELNWYINKMASEVIFSDYILENIFKSTVHVSFYSNYVQRILLLPRRYTSALALDDILVHSLRWHRWYTLPTF
jgi:hypothetical protein